MLYSNRYRWLASAACLGFIANLSLATQAQAETVAEADNAQPIVVAAKRADAAALEFRSIVPVSALSEEDLQRTAVHNVAEALGLMPSVNVMNTGSSFFGGIDGAARGEGRFVSIRGLNSEYNVNLINGINVAQGMPYSRQVQLSLLPPSGLNTIVLTKVSTAAMDGDAIGGTVDFRTPTAFDYAKPFRMSLTASGRLETRARDYGDSGLGGGLAGEITKRFGADGNFGLYLSGYYDERHFANSEMAGVMAAQNDGGWAYSVASSSSGSAPAAGLDPQKTITQTGINVGVSNGYTTRWGGNGSLDWRPDADTQVYLRGSYASSKTEQNSTLSQFVSSSKSWTETVAGTGRYNLSVNQISNRVWYETNPEKAMLATAALGLDKKFGAWRVAPQVFFSEGHNDRPNHIELSARNNQSDNYNSGTTQPLGGTSITYVDNLPQPLMTSAIYNQLNNANTALLARRSGQLTEQFSGQTKYGAKIDLARDFEGSVLEQIRFGAKYSISHRMVTNRDWTNAHISNSLGYGGSTWASLGIATDYYAQVFPGVYTWSVPKVNHQRVVELFNQFKTSASFDTCTNNDLDNYNCNTLSGSEAVSAAYASATLRFGDLEVEPGLRFEHTAIRNTYWLRSTNLTTAPSNWASNHTEYNELLPSLIMAYRPAGSAVYRASFFQSYTRPAMVQLGGGATVAKGDTTTTITSGNPNLLPIRATNLDVSGDWKLGRDGQVMLGGFYKHLRHYMYDNGSGYINAANLPDTNTIYRMPLNGGSGDVYGLEAQLREKFTGLPQWFGTLGVNLSATHQWTKVDIGGGVTKRIQNAPNWLARAQMFWEKGPASIDLTFKYTGEYVSTYNALGQSGGWDDLYVRPIKMVDLHAGYRLREGLRADVSVANLLGAYSYWSHVGKETLAISDVVDSGRTVLLTVKWSM
ncbi:TonB-dependent receptor [Novosphingobium umbonatum]|uniref:TonB-dependent receptor n=1 Tax=Novosphingobium umbonatum TaxID=1908524 RepID=UPI001FE8AA3D|nr:TonB-dependent receptor [Novosphingobium umbonatum]